MFRNTEKMSILQRSQNMALHSKGAPAYRLATMFLLLLSFLRLKLSLSPFQLLKLTQTGVPHSAIRVCVKANRETTRLHSIAERKSNKVETSWEPCTPSVFVVFFNVTVSSGTPEGDFHHCEELPMQAEKTVKNELSPTAHRAVSVRRAWRLEGSHTSDRWYRLIIQKYIFRTDVLLPSSSVLYLEVPIRVQRTRGKIPLDLPLMTHKCHDQANGDITEPQQHTT